jgi:hypothetical protein
MFANGQGSIRLWSTVVVPSAAVVSKDSVQIPVTNPEQLSKLVVKLSSLGQDQHVQLVDGSWNPLFRVESVLMGFKQPTVKSIKLLLKPAMLQAFDERPKVSSDIQVRLFAVRGNSEVYSILSDNDTESLRDEDVVVLWAITNEEQMNFVESIEHLVRPLIIDGVPDAELEAEVPREEEAPFSMDDISGLVQQIRKLAFSEGRDIQDLKDESDALKKMAYSVSSSMKTNGFIRIVVSEEQRSLIDHFMGIGEQFFDLEEQEKLKSRLVNHRLFQPPFGYWKVPSVAKEYFVIRDDPADPDSPMNKVIVWPSSPKEFKSVALELYEQFGQILSDVFFLLCFHIGMKPEVIEQIWYAHI